MTTTEGKTDTINTGFSIAYPKEYDRRNWGKGDTLLNRIAEVTQGRILTDGTNIEQLNRYFKKTTTEYHQLKFVPFTKVLSFSFFR